MDLVKPLIDASYKSKPPPIPNLVVDKELSGKRVKVYKAQGKPTAYIVHRGTHGVHDIITDAALLTGQLEKTNRFKHSKRIQKEAEARYGAGNVVTVGHSLGGAIASRVGKRSQRTITYNAPVTPRELLSTNKKTTDIRTAGDVVSILRPLALHPKSELITLKGYSHSTGALNQKKFRNAK